MGLLSFLFGGKAPELTPEEIADIDSDCTTRDLRTGFSMHSAGDVGDPLASLDCLDEDAFGSFDD